MSHTGENADHRACEQGWRDCGQHLQDEVIEWRRDGGGYHQPMPAELIGRLPASTAAWFTQVRTEHGAAVRQVSGTFLRLLDHEITARMSP